MTSGRFLPSLLDLTGAPGAIRTHDLWLRRPTLYPAELRARGYDNFDAWEVVVVVLIINVECIRYVFDPRQCLCVVHPGVRPVSWLRVLSETNRRSGWDTVARWFLSAHPLCRRQWWCWRLLPSDVCRWVLQMACCLAPAAAQRCLACHHGAPCPTMIPTTCSRSAETSGDSRLCVSIHQPSLCTR